MLSNTSLYLSPCSCPILGGSSITAWATTPLLPKRGSSLSSIYLTCVCLEAWPEYIFPDGLVTTKNWNVISIIHCVEGAKTCILHEACIVRQTVLRHFSCYIFFLLKNIFHGGEGRYIDTLAVCAWSGGSRLRWIVLTISQKRLSCFFNGTLLMCHYPTMLMVKLLPNNSAHFKYF